MRVYFLYPWFTPNSSYHKYLINYSPEKITYVNYPNKNFGLIASNSQFNLNLKIKGFIKSIANIVKIPNIIPFIPRNDFDLIHCAHCLTLDKRPWVVDTERYWNFCATDKIAYSSIGKAITKKLLLQKQCKYILPWTNKAKEEIENELKHKDIKDKLVTLYPAIQPLNKILRKKSEVITLIFVSRLFYDKGGAAALEVMDKLTKNYDNVEGIIVSTTPSEMIELYKNNKKIKFLNLMSQEKLIKEVFSKADIFLYPGFFDTFGLAFLEAMALGLPIVTVDGFARKEIVENGKDGFIIYRPKNLDIKNVKKHSDMINQLVEKTAQLIDNKNLREKMGKNGMKKILSGKFSLIQRNKKLIKIYEEALEN